MRRAAVLLLFLHIFECCAVDWRVCWSDFGPWALCLTPLSYSNINFHNYFHKPVTKPFSSFTQPRQASKTWSYTMTQCAPQPAVQPIVQQTWLRARTATLSLVPISIESSKNRPYDLTSWIMSFRTAVNVGLAYTGFLLSCGCRASDDPRSCRLAALCRASKHISFWCSVCFVWKLSRCGIVIIKTKFWLRVVRLCFFPRYTRAWCNVRARSHDKAPVHFSEKSSIFGSPFLLIHRRWLH